MGPTFDQHAHKHMHDWLKQDFVQIETCSDLTQEYKFRSINISTDNNFLV